MPSGGPYLREVRHTLNGARSLVLRLCIVILIGGVVAELAFRTVLSPMLTEVADGVDFYAAQSREMGDLRIDAVFIGSSRTAGSVVTAVVDSVAAAALGRPFRSIQVAMGLSTLTVHYLGLERLYREWPNKLKGATIVLEAPDRPPAGYPEGMGWSFPESPEMTGALLPLDDLPAFFQHNDDSPKTKMYVLLSRLSHAVRYRKFFKAKLESNINKVFLSPTAGDPSTQSELRSEGGIRADSVGIATTIERIRHFYTIRDKPKLPVDWPKSASARIAELAAAHGGKVVFVRLPESSIEAMRLDAPARQANQRGFSRWVDTAGLDVVTVDCFLFTDLDFPDLSHLRASRSREFSTELAEALTPHFRR